MENKVIIATLTALVIALLTSRNLWAKEKLRNKTKFREPFLKTLEKINRLVPGEYDSITDILKADYPIHETAFITYTYHLSFVGRWLLRKKWLAYRGECPKYPELHEEDYRYRFCHFIPISSEDDMKKREQVIKAINKLIA